MSSLSEHGYGSLNTGQGSPHHLLVKNSPRHVYTLGNDSKGKLAPNLSNGTNAAIVKLTDKTAQNITTLHHSFPPSLTNSQPVCVSSLISVSNIELSKEHSRQYKEYSKALTEHNTNFKVFSRQYPYAFPHILNSTDT